MKNERGSITLFTLVAMVFLLTIAFTAYASAMVKLQGQNAELDQIQANYSKELNAESLSKKYGDLSGTREWLQGAGTEQDPYKIYTIEDLLELSNRTNSGTSYEGKYIEMMNDLDFNDVRSYEKYDRTDFGDVNNNGTVEELRTELTTGEGWQAIGSEAKKFQGNFAGNRNEIKNLYINNSKNVQGLFGYNNCNIHELTVEGKITSTDGVIGGIAGINNGNITKCCSRVTSTGKHAVGGVAGYNHGTVSECRNYNKITGTATSSDSNAGGIVGYNYATINKSYNEGNIVGPLQIGGITAVNRGTVNMCVNNGTITCSNRYGGGIVAWQPEDASYKISNCYNLKDINVTTSNAGGIVGALGGQATNCYSIGRVTCPSIVHSVIGSTYSNATATYCYYLSTLATTDDNAIAKSSEEMKTQEFVNLLNTDQADQPWTMDTTNINNGYPILKWQLNQ